MYTCCAACLGRNTLGLPVVGYEYFGCVVCIWERGEKERGRRRERERGERGGMERRGRGRGKVENERNNII